ncbi:MAG: SCO family protein [Chloroflexi bacterium]|nr:SCO family protein [Chloroflexota bacterium]
MDKKTLWVGLGVLLILAIASALTFLFAKPASFRGTSYAEPYPPAGDVELTQANGEIFRLSDQSGKIVLLFFGYTSCPDVCPTTMAEMKQALDNLGEDAKLVQVVFVTVDPARDTPEKIQEYANHFHKSFIGLTGSEEQLQPIWNDYGVVRQVNSSNSASGYIVDHTARLYLIDTRGNLRLSYTFGTPTKDIVFDLKLLLEKSQ